MGRPSIGEFVDACLCLFGQHVFLDFPSIFSDVGPPAEHELVGHDSECEVVDGERVFLPVHDFGRHVARSATGVIGVVLSELPGDSKIGYPHIAI